MSVDHANTVAAQEDAKAAFDYEKNMTVRQAIRLYKKAIFYSMAMSLAVVMEG
jgi:SP family general alpha glucoside:H+ symporter-like MFS transporter